jgi:hypothetical protein
MYSHSGFSKNLYFSFSQIYLIILHDINIDKEFISQFKQIGMAGSIKKGRRKFA